MSTLCPACHFPLVEGVLRCKACGARATEPLRSQGVAGGFRLLDVVPDGAAAATALDELEEFAPEVSAWVRQADGQRRARLAEILARLVAAMERMGRG